MISILIPVYNYNCFDLVNDLHQQAEICGIDYEILVAEDGSTSNKEQNRKMVQLTHCRYIELPQNIGRAKIRNFLADEAQYEYLLFIDCDATIQNSQYIARYISFCREKSVVVGGTAYDRHNTDKNVALRLKYGIEREGNTHYKKNFTTFNFLINKHVFQSIRFDENIQGYGHEDTLFGIQLIKKGIPVLYIDNTLIHRGLDMNNVFISKSEKAAENLLLLHKKYPEINLANYSHLLKTYLKLKKYGFLNIVAFLFSPLMPLFSKQLCSSHPSLFLFDLYKFGYLCIKFH